MPLLLHLFSFQYPDSCMPGTMTLLIIHQRVNSTFIKMPPRGDDSKELNDLIAEISDPFLCRAMNEW